MLSPLKSKEIHMNYWTLSKDNIWVAAHRGFSKKYPENTMLAFKEAVIAGRRAYEAGLGAVEHNFKASASSPLTKFLND